MIRCILIGIFMSISQCYAQQEASHFFFNRGIHVDFSNNQIKIDTNSQIRSKTNSQRPTTASIADQNGRLLFYTDGIAIYTAENNKMKGSDGIKGIAYGKETPSCIIFPIDQSGYLYYLITMTLEYHFDTNNRYVFTDSLLYYHLVDMRLDNSKGEVVSKNNPIGTHFFRSLTAVKHRNGYDTWLVGRNVLGGVFNKGSFDYYAYLFTSCGISKEVKSTANGFSIYDDNFRTLLSPDGKLISSCRFDSTTSWPFIKPSYYIDRFDDSTGKITPWFKISGNSTYDFTFSPDSRFIYINKSKWIDQYDLTLPDTNQILQSIRQITLSKEYYSAFGMQNLPRGRTLVTTSTRFSDEYPYEGMIQKSNEPCPDCAFSDQGLYLPFKTRYTYSYNPTYFMSSFFRPGYKTPEPFNLNPSIETKTLACAYDSVHLKGNSTDAKIDSLVWVVQNTNGDTLKKYKGKEWKTWLPVGTYTATITAWRSCVNASAKVEFILEDKPIARINDKTQDTVYHCANTPIKLRGNEGNYAYLWGNGAKEQEIEVTQSGQYTLQNSNTCGSASANIVVQEDIRTVPNVITPNGDGINDTWNISNKSGQPFSVKIINRWGSELFSSSDYKNDFGTDVMAGMYFYLITQKGDCQEKGWLEVVK